MNEKALRPVDQLRNTLVSMGPEFRHALPANVDPEKFIRVAMTAVQNDPVLVDADRRSLLGSFMKCAQDGLLPDGREAAIVRFRDSKKGVVLAQYMPMIGGLLKKMRNSGEILSVSTNVVYQNDRFDYVLGDDERIEHAPALSDRGEPVAAYAIIRTKDGGIYREVMSKEDIYAVRDVSRAKESGPWAGPFETEMWRKTVLRRCAKKAPMSSDVETLFESDNKTFEFDRRERDITPPPAGPRGPSRLKSLLSTRDKPQDEVETFFEGGAEAAGGNA